MTREPTALICGTFDVANYGDLLFPIVAAHRLAPLGWRLQPVSPTVQSTGFADALPVAPLADIPGRLDFEAVLVGGGEIIHGWRADFLREYRIGDLPGWAYTGLWFGAGVAAALADVTLVWNAPGVPSVFPEGPRRLALHPALRAADYVAVRDEASRQFLGAAGETEIAVVPDTIAELSRVWPLPSLAQAGCDLRARKEIGGEEALLAIHIRPGGFGPATPEALAAQIAEVAAARGLVPLLLSIGPCLGDAQALRQVSAALPVRHIRLDDPRSLRELAAALAMSRFYAGNSMHGYVTAASYGVPGVIIGRPAFRKFAGFAGHLGRAGEVVRNWEDAWPQLAARLGETPQIGAAVLAALDGHWQRVAEAIATPAAGRDRRAAFLRSVVAGGLGAAGYGWLTQPFISRAAAGRAP
jgi:hypothetical protein